MGQTGFSICLELSAFELWNDSTHHGAATHPVHCYATINYTLTEHVVSLLRCCKITDIVVGAIYHRHILLYLLIIEILRTTDAWQDFFCMLILSLKTNTKRQTHNIIRGILSNVFIRCYVLGCSIVLEFCYQASIGLCKTCLCGHGATGHKSSDTLIIQTH